MKGIIYDISVSGGWLEANHGMFQEIKELYIPELKFRINLEWMGKEDDAGNRYEHDNPMTQYVQRKPTVVKEVEVPANAVMDIKLYMHLAEEQAVTEKRIETAVKGWLQ